MTDLRSAALAALAAGTSIIPIYWETKKPTMAWHGYTSSPVGPKDVERWFGPHKAFAGIGGAVSGNLLICDFDVPGYFEEWAAAIPADALERLVLQQTGGGCYQAWCRSDAPVGGNEKLAWHPAPKETMGREVAIETRGEGGYAVMAPSLHPSGKRYELVQGSWEAIPTLPAATVELLLDAARRLCKAPFSRQEQQRAAKAPRPQRPAKTDGESVIAAYNAAHPSITETLARYGYTPAYAGRWNRPGGSTMSVQISADGMRSFHHSSNDPMNNGHQNDSFNVFETLGHNGDRNAAVKAAARELGMSGPVPKPPAQPVHVPAPRRGLKGLLQDTIDGKRRNIDWTLPKLSRLGNALLPATCTVVCGNPGTRKSFFTLWEAFNWHAAGERVALKMLEEGHDWHMNRALALIAGDARLQDAKWVAANPKEAMAAYERHESVLEDFGRCIEDAGDDQTQDDLLRWANRKADEGAQILVIDPVTMADGKSGKIHVDDKEFIRGLRDVQNRKGVRTILVTHPKGAPRPGDDPMDNIAGGRAYSRFTQTILVLRSHRKTPRAAKVKGSDGFEVSMWLQASLAVAKARNGRGEGVDIAIQMDPATLRMREVGLIVGELKAKDMVGLSPPDTGA